MHSLIIRFVILVGLFFPALVSAGKPMIFAGGSHSFALKADGTVMAWGNNDFGQLGDGTTIERLNLVTVPGLTNVAAISTSDYHSIALKSDGTVMAWGENWDGKIGDGTTTNRLTPVIVPSLARVVAVAADNYRSIAIKFDGTVMAWGQNNYGQLGDGTTTNRLSPVDISGLTGVISVAATEKRAFALKSDGTVMAWGINDYGQLGDGTRTNRLSPVVLPLKNIVAISTGQNNAIALKSDGTVMAWGSNWDGELGDGTTTSRLSPVTVSGLTGVVAIAAGQNNFFALKSDGTVMAWGSNLYGQLGDGSTTKRLSPVTVSSLTGVVAIAAGAAHAIVLKSDGTLMSWGDNRSGGLGDGTTSDRLSPIPVTGGLNLNVSTAITSAVAPISNDLFFAYAEANYPSLFPGAATKGQHQQYEYSYYPASSNYLAVDNYGTIFVLGTYTGNVMTSFGPVSDLANTITAWEKTSTRIVGLSATQQADGSLFFTGTYQGSAVRFTHQGDVGKGQWAFYSGSPSDRTRVTISDTAGLEEALSIDKGYWMTVNVVGTERIEYRNYSSDGKFLYGAVLYQNGAKWLQGLMFTETFSSYGDLVTVTDVTAQLQKDVNTKSKRMYLSSQPKADGVENLSILDQLKSYSLKGAGLISDIVKTTVGIADSSGVVATAKGVVIAGAITLLGAPAVTAATILGAGYVIGSAALDYKNGTVPIEVSSTSNSADYKTWTDLQPITTNTASTDTTPAVAIPSTAPVITSVSPSTAIVGQSINIIVRGSNLGGLNGLNVSLDDCPNIATAGGTDTYKAYVCTPSSVGTKFGTVKEYGRTKVLFDFSIIVSAPSCVSPQVLKDNVCVTPTPTCVSPQILQGNVCVTPTPTCVSPQILKDNKCVTPLTDAEQTAKLNRELAAIMCSAISGHTCSDYELDAYIAASSTKTDPTCPSPQVLQGGVCVTSTSQTTPSTSSRVEGTMAVPNNDGITVIKNITHTLYTSDGIGSVCGKTLYNVGINNGQGTRIFNCDGTGTYTYPLSVFNSNQGSGNFIWGYAVLDTDKSKLNIKSFKDWGWGIPTDNLAALIYINYTSGQDSGTAYGGIIGINNGKVVQGMGYGYGEE